MVDVEVRGNATYIGTSEANQPNFFSIKRIICAIVIETANDQLSSLARFLTFLYYIFYNVYGKVCNKVLAVCRT